MKRLEPLHQPHSPAPQFLQFPSGSVVVISHGNERAILTLDYGESIDTVHGTMSSDGFYDGLIERNVRLNVRTDDGLFAKLFGWMDDDIPIRLSITPDAFRIVSLSRETDFAEIQLRRVGY